MKLRLWDYLKAAFNARPWGMLVPPNWIGIAAFALLGVLSSGFWLIGAGLEIAYLYLLAGSARFRAHADAQAASRQMGASKRRIDDVLAELDRADRARYTQLRERCQVILAEQDRDAAGLEVQEDELRRLLSLYLRLLVMRANIRRILREARESGQDSPALARRVQELTEKIAREQSEDLRRSLSSQLDLLKQRWSTQEEAEKKVAYLDAELARIEQQVELLREQTALSGSTENLSLRIDTISSTLGETMQWVQEQEEIFGGMDELADEAPRLLERTGKEPR